MQPARKFWYVVGAAFVVAIFTWFVWYPLAGYNNLTLTVAMALNLAIAVGFAAGMRMDWAGLGLGQEPLVRALLVTLAAHAVVTVFVLILNALGAGLVLLRPSYDAGALLSAWILTALGEELLFAGVIFNFAPVRRRWLAVLLVAALFGLWHLPGYVAIGLRTGGVGVGLGADVLLNVASWLIFGTIYLLGGNLWLAVLAHGTTDYALIPAIVETPYVGVVFMACYVGAAWWLSWRWKHF
jgi:membrane protease YdiL (CAAX protease family)